jgi:hypothetical protein
MVDALNHLGIDLVGGSCGEPGRAAQACPPAGVKILKRGAWLIKVDALDTYAPAGVGDQALCPDGAQLEDIFTEMSTVAHQQDADADAFGEWDGERVPADDRKVRRIRRVQKSWALFDSYDSASAFCRSPRETQIARTDVEHDVVRAEGP